MTASDIKQLLLIIEQQLDWGSASTWQSKDFEILNELILEKTKVSLSASTLRRLWGRVEYNHLPSGTTLDTLSKFAGYENWRTFTRRKAPTQNTETVIEAVTPKPVRQGWLMRIALVIFAVLAISLVGSFYIKKSSTPFKGSFSFITRPVTRDIPNSVIFNYDARVNPEDSVFIQQSWDPDTRVTVDKNRHEYTSVYYRPGFYHAKLVVNKNIVKEKLLLIPTNGWLGLIAHRPIPVYLSPKEFISKDSMDVPVSTISKKNIPLEPQPPMVEYYNVGNFDPVSLKDFSFSAEVKNGYYEGAATCQLVNLILFTDNYPIIVQLCAKGCVSDLRLLNGAFFVSGKNTDLSGFGADLTQWVKITCKSIPDRVQYYVNDKLVYSSPRPAGNVKIVGIGCTFEGTGAMKNISLKAGDKTVFDAY